MSDDLPEIRDPLASLTTPLPGTHPPLEPEYGESLVGVVQRSVDEAKARYDRSAADLRRSEAELAAAEAKVARLRAERDALMEGDDEAPEGAFEPVDRIHGTDFANVPGRRVPAAPSYGQVVDLHAEMAEWAGSDSELVDSLLRIAYEPVVLGPDEHASVRRSFATSMRDADLFYVTGDMVQVAAESAADIDGMALRREMLPGPCSLVVLDSTDTLDLLGTPLRAFLLIDTYAAGVIVFGFADSDVYEQIGFRDGIFKHAAIPPAVLVQAETFSYGDTRFHSEDITEAPETARAVRRLLLALLHLMREERYTERERPERAARRRWERSKARVPEDGCLSVTRLRRPHREVVTESDGKGRRYTHRWVVRAHFRVLHRGTPDERAILIHPYVKGPADAPFVPKRKVTLLDA